MNSYATFYLQGRSEVAETGVEIEIDLTAVAERVIAGEKLATVTTQVATDALKAKQNSRERRDWFEEMDEDIKDAGGDKEKAYALFCEGRVDELRHIVEDELVNAMTDVVDADGEDDEAEPEEDGADK